MSDLPEEPKEEVVPNPDLPEITGSMDSAEVPDELDDKPKPGD